MEEQELASLLFGIFIILGIFLLALGFGIIRRMYGRRAVQIPAECVDVEKADLRIGISVDDYTYYPNTKRPCYRYTYEGREYLSRPLLRSNRPGYEPKLGPCLIRIDPQRPERVYSSERIFAGAILMSIGGLYLIMVLVLSLVLR